MADVSTTRMVIASELTHVPQVQQAVLDQVKRHGHGQDMIFAVRLALEEALSNAIRHGNQGDPAKNVTVEYAVTEDEVRISIADEGPGFEPEKLPDPRDEENLDRPHGRGVMLMQAYMTKVFFNKKGNSVTMIRTRDGAPDTG